MYNLNDKAGQVYECLTAPIAKFAELNIETINNWAQKTDVLSDVAQAKKPEELINAQINLTQAVIKSGIDYFQKACGIWMETITQTGTTLANTVRKAQDTVRDNVKKASERPSKL